MKADLFRHGHELHYAVEEYFGDSGSLSASLKAQGDQTVQNMIHSLSPVIDDFQRQVSKMLCKNNPYSRLACLRYKILSCVILPV